MSRRDTLSASVIGLGATGPETIRGPVIVVRNTLDTPIALFVMIAPQLHKMFSICHDPVEFKDALRQYGINECPTVETMQV